MLSTFTTDHGLLVIRAEDLRRIEDGPEGCVIGWSEGDARPMCYAPIQGTARENLDRLIAEEAKVLAAYEEAQRRQQQGLPVVPVPRGKVRG